MLTIKGAYGELLVLGIPNNSIRKLYYNFIMENYDSVCNSSSSSADGRW